MIKPEFMHPYVVSLFSIVDHLFKKKWGRFGSDCNSYGSWIYNYL